MDEIKNFSKNKQCVERWYLLRLVRKTVIFRVKQSDQRQTKAPYNLSGTGQRQSALVD